MVVKRSRELDLTTVGHVLRTLSSQKVKFGGFNSRAMRTNRLHRGVR